MFFAQALRAKSRRDTGGTNVKSAYLKAAATKSKSAAGEASLAALHMRLAETTACSEMLLLDPQP